MEDGVAIAADRDTPFISSAESYVPTGHGQEPAGGVQRRRSCAGRSDPRHRRVDQIGEMNTWDAYAPFYDWENALTMGRRDVRFWQQRAAEAGGPVLELGCGTGRILMPIARSGVAVTGIDAS